MPNHTASKSCAQLAVCEKARIQLTLVVGANLRIIQKIVWEETCRREQLEGGVDTIVSYTSLLRVKGQFEAVKSS